MSLARLSYPLLRSFVPSLQARPHARTPSLPCQVANRVIVVHDDSGSRIGCGVIYPTTGNVVQVGAYPGYQLAGGLNVSGTVVIDATGSGLDITGTIGPISEWFIFKARPQPSNPDHDHLTHD